MTDEELQKAVRTFLAALKASGISLMRVDQGYDIERDEQMVHVQFDRGDGVKDMTFVR